MYGPIKQLLIKHPLSVVSPPPWLRRCLRVTGYCGLTLAVLINILLCFAIDNSPQQVIAQGLNREDIERAKQILHIKPEERDSIKNLSLNAKDLNIAASYLLNHFVENTTAIRFESGRLIFQIAIFVPASPWGRYLDFSFNIRQNQQGLYLKSLKIGEISIPDPMANWLVPFIVHNTVLEQYWQLARQYVQSVNINDQTLDISYLSAIVEQAKQLAVQKHKDYPSLPIYQHQINEIVNQHDPAWRLSLTELLQPLFATAYQRSHANNAIQENRAVIIAVASYVFKGELRRYLPIGLIYNKEYPVFAYKRVDIPQHFIASALLSAVDNILLGQQMGVDKEVGDAQQGSGFSFIDINSDQAGSRFGQLATASAESARRLQKIMAETSSYTDLIPDPQGLDEHMDENSFKTRYNSIDSPAYKQVIQQINDRIAALPLYQH